MELITSAQKSVFWLSCLLTSSTLLDSTNQTLAQIIPDRTLGQENSVVEQINPKLQHLEGGAIRGQNLFHSFLEFNILENSSAYFANPQGIINIFSRVTGNNASQIMGTLGVLGNANLFLVNPNGIMFGANAQLDITGSFVATSGSGFLFPNGTEFSAMNPQVPLLTVTATAPIGVKLEGSQGVITNQANLKVPQGQSINLISLATNNSLQPSSFVVPDNTLGAESSQVQAIDPNNELIVGGANRGINLFHSFLRFDVQRNKGVFFNNPQGIENILARVTGDNISRIRGTLGVKGGNADLYIINPNGLLFNQNASLDLNGSFIASTAGAIVFDQFDYRIVNPNFPPILVGTNGNSSSPIGLRIGDNPSAINVLNENQIPSLTTGNLGVKPEQTLAFIGGDVRLNNIKITSPSSNLILGGLNQGSVVNLEPDLSFNFPQAIAKADVQLINSSSLEVAGNRSGRIKINAGKLSIRNSSAMLAGIKSGLGFPNAQAGDIDLNVSDELIIDNSFVFNKVNANAIGNSGKILINTQALSVTNGGAIDSSTLGRGNAGLVNINASEKVTVAGRNKGLSSRIVSLVDRDLDLGSIGIGNSGGIQINTPELLVSQGGKINVSTLGIGNAGKITIDAQEVNLEGIPRTSILSGIFSTVTSEAIGSSQGIELNTNSLILTNKGRISASTLGRGNAGQIQINAQDITLDGIFNDQGSPSVISSQVNSKAIGSSRGIQISTANLALINGRINANTFGIGDAGRVEINASQAITINGQKNNQFPSGIFSRVEPDAIGNSQGIKIDTQILSLTRGGEINASTQGRGNAGLVDIQAQQITLEKGKNNGFPSRILSLVENNAVGQSSGIRIKTKDLVVTEGARINANTLGRGDAGLINVDADNIILDGFRVTSKGVSNSGIFSLVASEAVGESKGIIIETDSLLLNDRAKINASTSGIGNAGKIRITAQQITLDGRERDRFPSAILSPINSQGLGGSDGIEILTQNLELLNGRINTGTFGQGDAGQITITAENIIVDGAKNDRFPSAILSQVFAGAVGNSENIKINSQNISLVNGGIISASTDGVGNTGLIEIDTKEISLDGEGNLGEPSGIFSTVEANGIGDSKGIKINTETLSLTNGGEINASTGGKGNAGLVQIIAQEQTSLDGGKGQFPSRIVSLVDADLELNIRGEGDSGGISIDTPVLAVINGGRINASTRGDGDAGLIDIRASNIIVDGEIDNAFRISSGILSLVQPRAVGNSQGIAIFTDNLEITNKGRINANTLGEGDAGAINIQAKQIILDGQANDGNPSGILSQVNAKGKGNSGGIIIETDRISLLNGRINASTLGTGKAGKIIVNASEEIIIDGAKNDRFAIGIFSTVQSEAQGNSEGIELQTPSLFLTDGGVINASTIGKGNAGEINIDASEQVFLSGTYSSNILNRDIGGVLAFTTTDRKAGDINITTPRLTISERSGIEAFTRGKGKAGSITIDASEKITLNEGTQLIVESSNIGRAGDINLRTPLLTIKENAQLSSTATQTSSSSTAGNINLQVNQLNISGELGIFAETQSIADAGTLNIQPFNDSALKINFLENGIISASTLGDGEGGDISISAPQNIRISGNGNISVQTRGSGQAGSIEMISQNLYLTDGININASTLGDGDAGSIKLDANTLQFKDVQINAFTNSNGNAGSIILNSLQQNAARISLKDTNISSEIRANGQADKVSNITVQTDNLTMENSSINVSTLGKGNAGNITIPNAKTIDLNSSEITASTSGVGDTGAIALTARQNINLSNNSEISTSVESGGIGNSQKITISTPILRLNQSAINASTNSQGNAGSINISDNGSNSRLIDLSNNARISTEIQPNGEAIQASDISLQTDNLTIANSIITASTAGKGDAGSIKVEDANKISLNNASEISTSVISAQNQEDGKGGNIDLSSTNLTLEQQSIISATTNLGDGGNIELTIANNLNLFQRSQISTEAGNDSQGGDGGNITIIAGSIFAFPEENSDINANAFNGQGGEINIFTTTLFGVESRDELSRFSDITASSQLGIDGTIEINRLNVDPVEGFRDLPATPVEVQIAQGCSTAGEGSITFYDLGQGGLTAQPEDFIRINKIPWNPLTIQTTPQNSWRFEKIDQTQVTSNHFSCSPLKKK